MLQTTIAKSSYLNKHKPHFVYLKYGKVLTLTLPKSITGYSLIPGPTFVGSELEILVNSYQVSFNIHIKCHPYTIYIECMMISNVMFETDIRKEDVHNVLS